MVRDALRPVAVHALCSVRGVPPTAPDPSPAPLPAGAGAPASGSTGADPRADRLLDALSPTMLALMDELSGTMFCAKGVDGRYVAVNQVFVARTSERSRRAVLGRRAEDLFIPELAEHYTQQDAVVLGQGRALRHLLELIRRPGGEPGWYVTSKLPVHSGGELVGLVSVSQDLRSGDTADVAVHSLSRVVALAQERVADPPSVAELAHAAGCSASTLERRMRAVFGLSPQQFVLRTRIDHATSLLTSTRLGIVEVAERTGFSDQAGFTRTFGRLTGETPAQFRRRSTSVRAARRAAP